MEFSDYIIYVDESGDHSLEALDPQYPIFVLSFCIFKKTDYTLKAVPAAQQLKFKWFGHDLIILHENEIVKRKYPFSFLQYNDLRTAFMTDLTNMMAEVPMTVISAVIRKDALRRRYTKPENPYQLALLFCLEKAREFLAGRSADTAKTHVICESRSPKSGGKGREDRELELEFLRIVQGQHILQRSVNNPTMPCFQIEFASKLVNSTGLQIADLIARPIGLRILRGEQPNRAFETINSKIWRGSGGNDLTSGLKVFP